MFSLKGKNAIVTGASGYLGKEMCIALLENGANIDLYGRGDKIVKLHSELQDNYRHCKVIYHDCDLYNDIEFKECLLDSIDQLEQIHILVNNAYDFSKDVGFNSPTGRLEDMTKEMFMKGMDSGVYWSFLSTQIIGFHMCKYGEGSIINISSMYGSEVVPDVNNLYEGTDSFNPPTYSIVKSGIHHGLTKYSASHYSKFNIRVNSISPGAFPNLGGGKNKGNNVVVDRLIKKTPLKRVGEPKDLGSAVVFLASDGSSFMTGQNLVIDGGLTII